MNAILATIFSSFWTWLGTMFLIYAIASGASRIILSIRGIEARDDKVIDMKLGAGR